MIAELLFCQICYFCYICLYYFIQHKNPTTDLESRVKNKAHKNEPQFEPTNLGLLVVGNTEEGQSFQVIKIKD